MQLLQQLWFDEQGAVLSAEVATVATVGVVSTVVGLNAMTDAVNGELRDLSQSFRSLDQSYHYRGFRSCRAWFAGSGFHQRPVHESIRDMCGPGPHPEDWDNPRHLEHRSGEPRRDDDRRDDDRREGERRDGERREDEPREDRRPRGERRDSDAPRDRDDEAQAIESIDTPAQEKL